MNFPKSNIVRDKKYLKWQKGRECLINNHQCDPDTVAHHINTGGMGMKCGDDETVTLCHYHHLGSNDAVHFMGKKKFEKEFGVDLKEIAKSQYKEYKGESYE